MTGRLFTVIIAVICMTGLLSGCGGFWLEWLNNPSVDEWNGKIYNDKTIDTASNERFQHKMEKLRNPDSVKSLWIRISDPEEFVDLEPLTIFKNLESLTLLASGKDLTPLASLVELETLSLNLRSLSIGDMTPIASLTKLEKLSLELSNYSESAIMSLTSLTNLKALSLDFSVKSVTTKEQSIAQENDLKTALEKALPGCNIRVSFRYPGDDGDR